MNSGPKGSGPKDSGPKDSGPKDSGPMNSGTPVDRKKHRRRRLRATARMRARRVEAALDQARDRAARTLAPHPDTLAAHRAARADAERAMRELDATGRVFTRRDTGAQVRLRDTLAHLGEAAAASAAAADRYEVACLTHHSDPRAYDDAAAAARAARHSDEWCEGCRQLALVPHSVRARIRTRAKELRRAGHRF